MLHGYRLTARRREVLIAAAYEEAGWRATWSRFGRDVYFAITLHGVNVTPLLLDMRRRRLVDYERDMPKCEIEGVVEVDIKLRITRAGMDLLLGNTMAVPPPKSVYGPKARRKQMGV